MVICLSCPSCKIGISVSALRPEREIVPLIRNVWLNITRLVYLKVLLYIIVFNNYIPWLLTLLWTIPCLMLNQISP